MIKCQQKYYNKIYSKPYPVEKYDKVYKIYLDALYACRYGSFVI